MRKVLVPLACVALLVVSCTAVAAEECRYSAPRDTELDAAGLKLLAVRIGRDELVIHGEPGATKVVVKGTACASEQKWLPDITLEAARHGDTANLVAHDGDRGNVTKLFGSAYAYLKLDVSVPPSLAVKLREGSGDAQANSLAELDATLGSGDLKVRNIAGQLALRVSSGDVSGGSIGSLDLASLGSGDVGLDGVRGDVRVGAVGSGDLTLSNIDGNIAIGSLSSGDIKVNDVGGNLTAGSVGSGNLVVRDIQRDVTVRTIASGGVSIAHAGGNVHADSLGSGDLGADGVGGDFSVGVVGSGDLHQHGVKGKVSVPRSDH